MATEQAGPSWMAAGGFTGASPQQDLEANLSAAEKKSLAAVRDILAQERAELEREKRRKKEREQEDAALARLLHEEQLHEMGNTDADQPTPGCPEDTDMPQAAQTSEPHNGSYDYDTMPSAPSLPRTPVNITSSSGGALILPDTLPVIIHSSPGTSAQFNCCPMSPADPISVSDSPSPVLPTPSVYTAAAGPSTSTTGGRCDDVSEFQRQVEAQARAMAQQQTEDERLAKLLQEKDAEEQEAMKKQRSDLDAEMAAEMMAQLQREERESANRDSELAAQAWANEQKLAELAKQRELQDLEAARMAQEEEERQAQELQAAREAQAAVDERVVQLLDRVSQATQQDIADLDRAAIIADEASGPTFECPLLFIDCNKEEEGTCVGQWGTRMCNHWISTDALVQYICQEAEEQRFRMRCPVCAAARCERCTLHDTGKRDGGCCYIPPRQIRSLLSAEQMARLLYLQEQWYRTANKDKIVQCPHPDCQFFYALEAEDLGGGEDDAEDGDKNAADGDAGEGGGKPRWQEGRDMWCDTCEMRYCLHCGDAMGTLVRWHAGKTCTEFLQEAENAKSAAERKRLEKVANEGHEQNRGKTWQRCPKCGYEAWKADGQCNRVVCKEHCGTNFCFLCGEDITRLRYKHYELEGHPCHYKVWHHPLAGTAGAPPCRCASCRRS